MPLHAPHSLLRDAALPGELLARFNLDPVLIGVLLALALGHRGLLRDPRMRIHALAGWTIAAFAFLTPLCALSVSLFSARVAQHMMLVLIAAPLIALALPISIPRHTTTLLVAGLLTSTQMCLLGALLSLAAHPLFDVHLLTTPLWGLTPLEDQQLGGIIMWVPGILLFLWATLRSLQRLFSTPRWHRVPA